MSSRNISRRDFIRATTGLAAYTTVLSPRFARAATGSPAPPSDRIGLGIIGVGMQGSGLLGTALSLPGIECVGAAELYDGRLRLAKEIAGDDIFATRDYRELLARPGLDAVIVATPDHWHKQLVIDCCAAGKDVYCEKPLTHKVEDGFAMIEAARKHKRIVQVGSQRQSSVLYEKAREIVQSGALGTLTLVEASWGRNSPTGAWQYPVPPDASEKTIDWDAWLGTAPKRPFDPVRWARWRCWQDYGSGVAGDLFVHLITGILYIMGINEPPVSAQSTGGIFHWKDGRDVPDTLSTLLEYRDFPVYLRVSLASHTPGWARFLGTRGVLEINPGELIFTPQDGTDHAPSYFAYGWPGDLRTAYFDDWHEAHDPKPEDWAVIAGRRRFIPPPNYSDLKDHFYNFFESVRTRKPPVQNATFGHNAALGCHLANYSYGKKTVARWDPVSKEIRG